MRLFRKYCVTTLTCALFLAAVAVQPSAARDRGIAGSAVNGGVTDLQDDIEGLPHTQDVLYAEERLQQVLEASAEVKSPAQTNYVLEVVAVLFLICFGLNVLYGKRQNEKLALSWALEFCRPGAVIEKNFSLLGPGDSDTQKEILIKRSQNQYLFWASGRRYCSGMLGMLDLKARQDLLSMAVYLLEPRDDSILYEITMNDNHMPPMTIAVGLHKIIKTLLLERKDVQVYTKPLEVARDRIRDWPTSLSVVSESAGCFYDIFTEPVLELAFRQQVYSSSTGKYFRYLHFSSEYDGSSRKVLRFSFKLPPANHMHELGRLTEMMMKLIDVVGTYQMPQKIREKADRLRAEERKKSEKEQRRQQDEEIQRKKQERKEAELGKLKKLGPEARQKHEDRQKRIDMQRAMRKRTVKV